MLGRRRLHLALLASVAALGALGLVTAVSARNGSDELSVTVRNVNNREIGRVTMAQTRYGTIDVRAHLRGLTPGFHGFHVHAVGRCEAPGFQSAGAHAQAAGQVHRGHVGDLVPLLVKQNGTATLRVTTDRFRLADLRHGDGSAVVVHAGPDNLAHIPPRYAPQPDAQTLATGDSGERVACGAIAARP